MFGWEFPPFNSGGLGTACQGLTKGLCAHNVEVIFVLPKRVDLNVNYMRFVYGDEGISSSIKKSYFVNSPITPYMTSEAYEKALAENGGKLPPIYANSLAEEVERYGDVAKEIAKNEEFDVIHAHDWLTFKAGIAAKKVSGKYLVVHVHATEFDRSGGNGVNQYVYEIEKKGMQEADMVVAVSNFTKQKIIKHYGIPESKIKVVHNAVEFEDFIVDQMSDLKKNKKIVLFLGRITLQKGPDYFVSTAKKVLDYYKEVIFVMVGSGDMERATIRKVAELGIADKFIFTGFLRGKDTPAAYQMADLYIMPSVSEPFGITPLEAMYLGTPSLISNQSGVSEVVTHALKTDFWDTDEMANKIVSVLRHKELQNTLKQNGRKEVEKITWDKSAKRVVEIYHDLMRRKN
jgi:glycosyltransferase involved in cell wall biosynthesis